MDDENNLTLQGPHWRPRLAEATTEFVPLRLVVDGGEMIVEVDQPEMVAGRHSEADLQLPLPDVSRRHCRFSWEAGRWHVVDLGSLNGLWVNERRVQQAVLEEGDCLRLGGFAFIVRLSDASASVVQPSLYSVFQSLPQPARLPPRRLAS